MRITNFLLLVLLSIPSLNIAEEPRFTSAARIAIIDLDRAVRNSAEYKSKLAELERARITAEVEGLRAQRARIKMLSDQAKSLTPASPEYQALKEMMICRGPVGDEQKAKLAIDRIYGEIRVKAMAEIAAYAQVEKIDLVINCTPTSVKKHEGCGTLDTNFPPASRIIFSSCPNITDTFTERLSHHASR